MCFIFFIFYLTLGEILIIAYPLRKMCSMWTRFGLTNSCIAVPAFLPPQLLWVFKSPLRGVVSSHFLRLSAFLLSRYPSPQCKDKACFADWQLQISPWVWVRVPTVVCLSVWLMSSNYAWMDVIGDIGAWSSPLPFLTACRLLWSHPNTLSTCIRHYNAFVMLYKTWTDCWRSHMSTYSKVN